MIVVVQARPSSDLLAVYQGRGFRTGTYLWRGEAKNGLSAPNPLLVQQLERAMETAGASSAAMRVFEKARWQALQKNSCHRMILSPARFNFTAARASPAFSKKEAGVRELLTCLWRTEKTTARGRWGCGLPALGALR